MSDTNKLLATGIQALKNGQREEARNLFMQIVEHDERNEQAWLWLSGAVETDEDRRICLDNVLTINPSNTVAQKGLAKLKPVITETDPDLPLVSHQETDSPSKDSSSLVVKPSPTTNKTRKYNDVWTTTEDICAFCAHPINSKEKRCSNCKRKLTTKVFRDPVPSKYHRNLFVLLLIYNSLQVIGAILNFVLKGDWAQTIGGLIFAIPFLLFTAAIYFRQAWAYWLIVIGNILQIGVLIFIVATLPPPTQPQFPPLLNLICLTPFLIFTLFVYYTIFMAGADFRKIKVRQVASVSDKIKDANQYDKLAQKLAKKGMWASAILHWQRAIGRSPGHTAVHLRLSKAYAKLGFYERGLDSLTAAYEKTRLDESRQEILREIDRIKEQMNQKALSE